MHKVTAMILALLLLAGGVAAAAAEPPAVLEITLPSYRVETGGGYSYVSIPGGEVLLLEEGRPRVPYYVHAVAYPAGCRVQEVILEQRGGLSTATGLLLPPVRLDPTPAGPVEMKAGWYPEEAFSWEVEEEAGGGSTLLLAVYPFRYQPENREARYYTRYRFRVNYILTAVDLSALSVKQDAGGATFHLALRNPGEAADVVAQLLVRRLDSGEAVEGLPLRLLTAFSGEGSLAARWSAAGAAPGAYLVEAVLADRQGAVLDRAQVEFELVSSVAGEEPPGYGHYWVAGGFAIAVAAAGLVLDLLARRRRNMLL